VVNAWKDLQALGRTLVKDGRTLNSEVENLAELRDLAAGFAAEQLPLLRKLGVA
jgi:hypothetical protein